MQKKPTNPKKQMDSTPPSKSIPSETRHRLKSASRLARAAAGDAREISPLSLDLPPYSPARAPPSPPSKSIQELLLLSPSSPPKRSLSKPPPPPPDHIEAVAASEEPSPQRRRCKSCRSSQLGCSSSPRNARRTRRKVESEVVREERDLGFGEEIGKARKRRQSGRTKKEKLILVPSLVASPKLEIDAGEGRHLELIGHQLCDLIMWKHVSKSCLWFGIGSICFLSSCFANGINFSIFSAISRLGLLFLGVSFLSNSYCQRANIENRVEYRLKEEDVLRLGRIILPAANLLISVARELFSGEPSMTLKVAPFFLLGAEFGHLITLWRLCAVGFIVSFSVPKLYTCYSSQINKQVEHVQGWVLEAWRGCSHKKIVVASAATAFWNLFTIKARLFAIFISLVIFRCYKQLPEAKQEEGEGRETEDGGGEHRQQQQQALVIA